MIAFRRMCVVVSVILNATQYSSRKKAIFLAVKKVHFKITSWMFSKYTHRTANWLYWVFSCIDIKRVANFSEYLIYADFAEILVLILWSDMWHET